MATIFVSYRRNDPAAGYVIGLREKLVKHFGMDDVFVDIDGIAYGDDFAEVITEQLNACRACLVWIGKEWISCRDEAGQRRLDDPQDVVRFEVATALRRKIRVIPVLIGGATVPRAGELPEELKPLAKLNAIDVSHTRFDRDVEYLIEALERAIGNRRGTTLRNTIIGLGIASPIAILGAWWLATADKIVTNPQEPVAMRGGEVTPTRPALLEEWNRKGDQYYDGEGVTQDYTLAEHWYRKAASEGHAEAQRRLGVMYMKGLGVQKDDAAAISWFTRAAEQGNAKAQDNLGYLYTNGADAGARDPTTAMKWFTKAAEQGLDTAQLNLGAMYHEGIGVTADAGKALIWYRKAAEQGNADAQSRVGDAYRDGDGTVRDEAEAVKWYRLAAEQGNASAQNNLAAAYLEGTSVPKDIDEGLKWLRKAADQGLPEAQATLGTCYARGIGVQKNNSEAVRLLRLAASQGLEEAQRWLKNRHLEW